MTEPSGVTARLARFLVSSRPEDLPPAVLHEAKRSVLNWLGCALGGARDEAAEHAVHVLGPFSGAATHTVIGRAERFDMLTAAFMNGLTANVFDFDDTHLRTVIHPSAPVAPALFALAESRRIAGTELLHAFALGVDVECRVGNAVSPGHYARGWHITSTCGVIGAAAAAGRILGLDERRMAYALGHGATQSAGLIENLGTMSKSITVGGAPRNGLVAALLAQRGFTASERAIEGPRGFLHVLGDSPDLAAVTDGLGTVWELAKNTYKPYPAGVVLHPVIDACLDLRSRYGLAADGIARVVVRGAKLLQVRGDRPAPATGREAQVSIQHSVAVSFLHGKAGVPQFSDALVREPAVLALGARVAVEVDDSIPVEAAVVVVHTKDGRELREHVQHARGSLGRPMTDADLEAKFRELAAYGSPGCDASRLIDMVWALDRAPDASTLLPHAVPGCGA